MPAATDNYIKQFLSWLLHLLNLEQRGNSSASPIAETIRNPRNAGAILPAYPSLLRLNRDSAGRDVPIATYKACPSGCDGWDFWIICDRLGYRSPNQREIEVGTGRSKIKVRVVEEPRASESNLGTATSYNRQPTHRIVVFEMSRIPDSHGSYEMRQLFYGEINLITSFKLHDAIARELTRKLAKLVFWAYPSDIDWKAEVEQRREELMRGY